MDDHTVPKAESPRKDAENPPPEFTRSVRRRSIDGAELANARPAAEALLTMHHEHEKRRGSSANVTCTDELEHKGDKEGGDGSGRKNHQAHAGMRHRMPERASDVHRMHRTNSAPQETHPVSQAVEAFSVLARKCLPDDSRIPRIHSALLKAKKRARAVDKALKQVRNYWEASQRQSGLVVHGCHGHFKTM